MGLPERSLQEGEEIVLDMRTHWKRLVVPLLLLPLIVGAATFFWFALPDSSGWDIPRWVVVGLAAVLVLVFTVMPFLRWLTTNYVITNRRVVLRTGLLTRSGRDIPLTRVNDVAFEHSLTDRMLRCGTLIIESAGERGQVTLTDIPHVEDVQRELYALVEAEHARQGRGPS